MLQYNAPYKVAVITSYPPGTCPIATFSANLVENMIPASYGAFEPVLVAVESEISREYPDDVNFVIRRNFHSDYLEAADFVNAGNGDVVLVQHHFDLFGIDDNLVSLIQHLDVPVIATLHSVPQMPPTCHYEQLINLCWESHKVVVTRKCDFEILSRQYKTEASKIELITADRVDNPFEHDVEWFHIGRQYWQLVSEQLQRYTGDLRSLQAAKEQAVLFGQ